MPIDIVGVDIGGANLKAAHTGGAARTVPFALWKQPDRLAEALASLLPTMPPCDRLAVTMTGELCDCFATKREGVRHILEQVEQIAERRTVRVWTTRRRFVNLEMAHAEPSTVAAANWLALAQFVAERWPDDAGLLIDTGSTTTDITYFRAGQAEPRGLTDPDRLATGELVYTGLRRTPICAVLGMKVAAESFATMLDAHVYLGLVPENADDCDSADGRAMTQAFAHARLARMMCADAETFTPEQARELADEALRVQQAGVTAAIQRVRSGHGELDRAVVAGSGEIIARRAAQALGMNVTALSEILGPHLSEAASAYAVAHLAAQERNHA